MVIQTVVVIGAGLMGAGIAQNAAVSGFRVHLIDESNEALQKAIELINEKLERRVLKGSLMEYDKQKILKRIQLTIDIKLVSEGDMVIEAVPEDISLKERVFHTIDRIAKPSAILASNTSGLSIAQLGSQTSRSENVIGFHYFYPAPLMKLIEVTPSILTSTKTVETTTKFAKALGKEPVICNDYPGFLVNRILVPMMNEAIYCVAEGASPTDVDTAMKLGANHLMGPITLADFVGLDTLLSTMEGLYEGFSDSKYRPCPLLKKYVESGMLGAKTGRGFFGYDSDGNKMNVEGVLLS
ncbi:3-hydroxybutyryl-CoA dehydrogenase [Geomicrobium sp. JCM 19037]|uniref:3-hydroxyacyl-CoA dehydrogenase family protein n=1 Tax=Geomicrobium sp. JCM 19037 TaxID=1460634 RepID=UPI00045F214F|nr:3-hydroxyacyl-CoA dehydrogenase NAD-binding domain-containing protein [Geomicrobium sp. JCM 19037]GAK06285.1 3-hydroxybutyryl-CoA dehydrogenase [Geomicrobium sp. JCM 19037]